MIRAALVLALLALAAPAAAADWEVIPQGSAISFEYMRSGDAASGSFEDFSGTGTFDLAAPKSANIRLTIASRSIDLGEPIYSAFATSAEWFDSETWPNVIYQLLRLDPQPDGSFIATGDLTIRGTTEIVTTPVTLTVSGDTAHAAGTVEVNRRNFLLGVGPSDLVTDIGDTVAVRFDLTARRIN